MAFPDTILLDDFDRADDASLGPNWTEAVNGKSNRAVIESNTATTTGAGTSSIAAYTGTGALTSTSVACSATIVEMTTVTNDVLGLAVTQVADTTKGYHTEMNNTGADVATSFRVDPAGTDMSTVTATGFGMPVPGDLMGLIVVDDGERVSMEYWINNGSWTLIGTHATELTNYVPGPYYVSLRVKYHDESINDFKGVLLNVSPVAWLTA